MLYFLSPSELCYSIFHLLDICFVAFGVGQISELGLVIDFSACYLNGLKLNSAVLCSSIGKLLHSGKLGLLDLLNSKILLVNHWQVLLLATANMETQCHSSDCNCSWHFQLGSWLPKSKSWFSEKVKQTPWSKSPAPLGHCSKENWWKMQPDEVNKLKKQFSLVWPRKRHNFVLWHGGGAKSFQLVILNNHFFGEPCQFAHKQMQMKVRLLAHFKSCIKILWKFSPQTIHNLKIEMQSCGKRSEILNEILFVCAKVVSGGIWNFTKNLEPMPHNNLHCKQLTP